MRRRKFPALCQRTQVRWFAAVSLVLMFVFAAGVTRADDDESIVRWDIVSIDFGAGTVGPNGVASAHAADGSGISLRGTGRFSVHGDDDDDASASGRGTWVTFDPAGNETGRGTYRVTGFVDWDRAPGTPPPLVDTIGGGEPSAGLAVLRIRYSDRSEGILVISCQIVGTPGSVFEGITATKGFVDYWNREAPVPGIDANRTLFHVRDEDDDDDN